MCDDGHCGRGWDLCTGADYWMRLPMEIKRDACTPRLDLLKDSGPIFFRHVAFSAAAGGSELQTRVEEQVVAYRRVNN